MPKGIRAVLFGLAACLAFAPSFSAKSKAEFRLTRIIDELGPKDFLKSPLFNLPDRFPRREELIALKDLTHLGTDKDHLHNIFACALKAPALGGETSEVPPEIRVSAGSGPVPYAFLPGSTGRGWGYLKRTRPVAVNMDIFKGDRWSEEIILPSGKVDLTVRLSNPQPRDFAVHLRLLLDGRSAGDVLVKEQKRISISKEVKIGRHRLDLFFDGGVNLAGVDERGAYLKIEQLIIGAPADILLLALPLAEALPAGQSFKVSYALDPPRMGTLSPGNSVLSDYAFLYSIMNDTSLTLRDAGVVCSPASLKRKIHWKEGTANIILAPPSTEFVFTADLPDDPFLEFGYGIIKESASKRTGGMSFKVTCEARGQIASLFEKTLRPRSRDWGTVFSPVTIDLKRFRNQRVKLTFSTESSPLGKAGPTCGMLPAFWSNPVIFSPGPKNDGPLNVILISLDTLRADHLGCYGYSRPTSPGLDALASDGVRFDEAFSTSSWTLPAHVSMLTALTVAHHGVLDEDYVFGPSLRTLADYLRRRNYVTGAFTGGGYVGSQFGFAQGFDFYVDENTPLENPRSAGILLQESSDWIRRNAEKKFFLFLHSYQPHDPYSSPPPAGQAFLKAHDPWKNLNLLGYLGPHGRYKLLTEREKANVVALYDGDIKYTDEAFVGPLVRCLKDLGVYDRTMIIVTSDHGEEFYDHGSWQHGHSLYNEQIRIPLIIKFPESRSHGLKITTPVQVVDILPTVLEELDIPSSSDSLDGRSVLALTRQDRQAPRELLSEIYGRVEFPSPLKGASPCLRRVAIVNGGFKLILIINHNKYHYFFSPRPSLPPMIGIELYDLEKDPGEKVNLAPMRPELVRSLRAKIEAYFASAAKGKEPGAGKRALFDQRLAEKLKAFGYIH